jgi:hypothetical protein
MESPRSQLEVITSGEQKDAAELPIGCAHFGHSVAATWLILIVMRHQKVFDET